MLKHCLTLALSLVFYLVTGAAFAAPECPKYLVRAGDTLNAIATTNGNGLTGLEIYTTNREAIGSNPDFIAPGTLLALPCAPGTTPTETAVEGAPADTPATDSDPAATPPAATPKAGSLQILTGGPFPPFVGVGPDDPGMFTDLLKAALTQGSAGEDFEISYVNDRAAHLRTVMPHGGFDLVYPWTYPNCTRRNLDFGERAICADYIASDSFYENVTEFYTRGDNRLADAKYAADLSGASICHPEGTPVDALVRLGVLLVDVTLLDGHDQGDCLQRLDAGEVDLVMMEAASARRMIDTLAVINPMIVLDGFTSIDRLHVLARKDAPRALAHLARVNAGLVRITEDGTWYTIVEQHLSRP